MKKSIAYLLLGVLHLESIGKIGWRVNYGGQGEQATLRRVKHTCGYWPEVCCSMDQSKGATAFFEKCKSCPGQCLPGNELLDNCDDKKCPADVDCRVSMPATSSAPNQVISRFGSGSENFEFTEIFFPGDGPGNPPCLGQGSIVQSCTVVFTSGIAQTGSFSHSGTTTTINLATAPAGTGNYRLDCTLNFGLPSVSTASNAIQLTI